MAPLTTLLTGNAHVINILALYTNLLGTYEYGFVYEAAISSFMVLRTLRVENHIHELVRELAWFHWSYIAHVSCRSVFTTCSTEFLETFMFIYSCNCIAACATYLFPLTHWLPSHFHVLMILKAPITKKSPITFFAIFHLIFGAWWYSSAQITSFVTFMGTVMERITSVTYIILAHCPSNVANYVIMTLIVRIIQEI
jgi:hypothetical protein